MSATWLLAWRNLTRGGARLLVSVGGVALALTLVLALDAIFEGVSTQMTAYIDGAQADVWVAQSGVRNLHMVTSWLPASVVDEVRAIDGVAEAQPILYATDSLVAGEERGWAYVIGVPRGASMGSPAAIAEGSPDPAPGEAVIDRRFAQRAGVGIGGRVTMLGRDFRVVGLSEGTASLVNSVAFVTFDDFARQRGGDPVVSFVLVRVAEGSSADDVANEIQRRVGGVTAQTSATMAAAEKRLVLDMSGDVIWIMDAIGFVVGVAVVALTVYLATLACRREYGTLKAFGAPSRFLYGVVLAQAGFSVAIGFAVATATTAAIGIVVGRAGLDLELVIAAGSLAKVGFAAAIIAGLAAVLPINRIASLDPALIAREGA